MNKGKILIAMSGGVDSSVAAVLLKEQGYQVIAVMLKLWSDPAAERENQCCTLAARRDAQCIAQRLHIPFFEIDAVEVFRHQVVQYFFDEYTHGATPNPCVVCNRLIKWSFLLAKAQEFGADAIATGHYARIQRAEDGEFILLRGLDAKKDQSYVLSRLNQTQLAHTLLPLGELQKNQVRDIARAHGLEETANKPESQDLCFVSNRDYRAFLTQYIPQTLMPGNILNEKGEIIGEHQGLAFYTIGQRKGIRVAAPLPYYVLAKDMQQNNLIVAPLEKLGRLELTGVGVNWMSGKTPQKPFTAQVKIRYKANFVDAIITPIPNNSIHVQFDEPMRDITPGQFAVIYAGEQVLGSAVIV